MLSTPGGSGIPAKNPVFQRSPSEKYRNGIVVLQMDDEFSYLDDPVWQFALYEFINEDEEEDEETNTIEINLEITIDIDDDLNRQ